MLSHLVLCQLCVFLDAFMEVKSLIFSPAYLVSFCQSVVKSGALVKQTWV